MAHILQNFESKSDEKMKPLLCILASVLLSVSVWAQESKPLTYLAEYDVPGWTAEELFNHYCEWTLQNRRIMEDFFGRTHYEYNFATPKYYIEGFFEDFGMDDRMFAFSYRVTYSLSITCLDEGISIEVSNICAYDGDDEIWDNKRYHCLTQDGEGVRRGIAHGYWMQRYRQVREWLDYWFSDVSEILYEAAALSENKLDSRRNDPAWNLFFETIETPVTI